MSKETTKPGGYPANIENPDDWAAFLAHYLDNRATNIVHNGIGLVALHVVDAIKDAEQHGYDRGWQEAKETLVFDD